MKKILTAALLTAILMTLAASAFAATGVGSVTSVSVTPATADKAGSVSAYVYTCAVTLDENGVITGVDFDAVQPAGSFDTTGAAGEFNAAPLSKNEIKEGYGMKAISPIGLEWYEQMDKLEDWCIGKTVAALEAEIAGKDAAAMVDAVSGCTLVDTLGYVNGLIEAAKAAK